MKFVLCLKLAQSLGKYRMNERMSDRAESVRLDTFTDCDEREREREESLWEKSTPALYKMA